LTYGNPIFAKRTTYGFLKAKHDDYLEAHSVFMCKIKQREWVEKTSTDMIESIFLLHKVTRQIEKDLRNSKINKTLWEEYFSAISLVLRYKSFSDKCDPTFFSIDVEEYERNNKRVHSPSHILLFYRNLEKLKKNPNQLRIKEFIFRYGFLYDFNIARTPFEDEEYLKLLKNTSKNKDKLDSLERVHSNSFDIQLYKRLAWYEEMRHFYQARALRNYRDVFEKLQLDIFKTGIEDFHGFIERNDCV
jgi:hypothetical protein